VKQHNISDT